MTLMRYICIAIIAMQLLTGCRSRTELPSFTASGYLDDRGAVQVWRKNNQQQLSHILTVLTPFDGKSTEVTDYRWFNGTLISMRRHVAGQSPEDVVLRFDYRGTLNFMQRQRGSRRESLSADEIALYQFEAQRVIKVSDDLLKGRVVMIQGQWLPDNTVMSCQGRIMKPDFDLLEREYLEQRQRTTSPQPGVAWLEAPGGIQLLLVSAEDLCLSEPQAADF